MNAIYRNMYIVKLLQLEMVGNGCGLQSTYVYSLDICPNFFGMSVIRGKEYEIFFLNFKIKPDLLVLLLFM